MQLDLNGLSLLLSLNGKVFGTQGWLSPEYCCKGLNQAKNHDSEDSDSTNKKLSFTFYGRMVLKDNLPFTIK